MEEVGAAIPPQTGEEETQSRENAKANGHSSRENVLLPNGGVEEHAAVPKPQSKVGDICIRMIFSLPLLPATG